MRRQSPSPQRLESSSPILDLHTRWGSGAGPPSKLNSALIRLVAALRLFTGRCSPNAEGRQMVMVGEDRTRLARVLFAIVLTGIAAFGLYWGFLRDNRAETGAGMRVELDFTKLPDGPAPTQFDTGQPALSSESPTDPGSSFVVRNGALTYKPTTDDTTAAYFSTPDMGAPVSSLGARWLIQPGEGTNGAVALAVSQGVQKSIPQPVPP